MPMNVVHVKTGLMLNDLQSVGGFEYKVRIIIYLSLFIDIFYDVWNRISGSTADSF